MHNIGPYSVRGLTLLSQNRRVNNPAMIVLQHDDDVSVLKIGDYQHIETCYNRYLQSNTQYIHSMQLVEFDIEKVHIDIVCTIFNAVMHSAASFLLKTLLSNNEYEFMQCVSDLQAAGY